MGQLTRGVGQSQDLVEASRPLGQGGRPDERTGLRFRLDGRQDKGGVLTGRGRQNGVTRQDRGAG